MRSFRWAWCLQSLQAATRWCSCRINGRHVILTHCFHLLCVWNVSSSCFNTLIWHFLLRLAAHTLSEERWGTAACRGWWKTTEWVSEWGGGGVQGFLCVHACGDSGDSTIPAYVGVCGGGGAAGVYMHVCVPVCLWTAHTWLLTSCEALACMGYSPGDVTLRGRGQRSVLVAGSWSLTRCSDNLSLITQITLIY